MICIKCHKEVPTGPYCLQCGAKQTVSKRPKKRGNGTGTAFKRGRYWYAQVTLYSTVAIVDGQSKLIRKRRTKGGFATKREALEYIETLRKGQGKTAPTLLELYELWERSDLPKLSKSKQDAYRIARKRLEPIIHRRVDMITTSDLQNTVNSEADTFYKARDMKVLLSHLLKRAAADQFVPTNLAQYISLPSLNESDAEPFTPDEVDKMWTAFADGEVFVGYLLLMIYSGMMPGELLACRVDQIDLERNEIYGCGKKTKARKDVAIVFADCVKPVVLELIESTETDMLWSGTKNQWYDKYHETVKKIGVRDLPPYSCRHTTGTEAARQNLNASTIQKIMRHSKITTSQRYIHLGSEEARSGLNSMANS